jgi:hypothetical protein
MTFRALLKRLKKMKDKQLSKPVCLYEGCSGNWTKVTAVLVGSQNNLSYDPAMGEQKPLVKKGECYLIHDH